MSDKNSHGLPLNPYGKIPYHYCLAVIDNFIFEGTEIRISEYTRITRTHKIRNIIGRLFLGPNALTASKSVSISPPTRSHEPPSSRSVYPAFDQSLWYLRDDDPWRLRVYETSDFIIENDSARIKRANSEPLNSEDINKLIMSDRALISNFITALRLLRVSDVRVIGPATFTYHPAFSSVPEPVGSVGRQGQDMEFNFPQSGENVFYLRRREVKELLQIMKSLRSLPNSLDFAIRRLNSGIARRSAADRIVDFVIGLEALYSPNKESELGYRISTRIAAHQCDTPSERAELIKTVRDLYSLRSALVHGAIHDPKEHETVRKRFGSEDAAVATAHELVQKGCLRSIRDVILGTKWSEYGSSMDKALCNGRKFLRP